MKSLLHSWENLKKSNRLDIEKVKKKEDAFSPSWGIWPISICVSYHFLDFLFYSALASESMWSKKFVNFPSLFKEDFVLRVINSVAQMSAPKCKHIFHFLFRWTSILIQSLGCSRWCQWLRFKPVNRSRCEACVWKLVRFEMWTLRESLWHKYCGRRETGLRLGLLIDWFDAHDRCVQLVLFCFAET